MYSLKISGTFDKKLCDCKLKESLQTVIKLYENEILLDKYINNNEFTIFSKVTFGDGNFKTDKRCFNEEFYIGSIPTELINKFKELNIYTEFEEIRHFTKILRNTGKIDIKLEFTTSLVSG